MRRVWPKPGAAAWRLPTRAVSHISDFLARPSDGKSGCGSEARQTDRAQQKWQTRCGAEFWDRRVCSPSAARSIAAMSRPQRRIPASGLCGRRRFGGGQGHGSGRAAGGDGPARPAAALCPARRCGPDDRPWPVRTPCQSLGQGRSDHLVDFAVLSGGGHGGGDFDTEVVLGSMRDFLIRAFGA